MKRYFFFIFLMFVSLVVVSCASKKLQEPVVVTLEKTKEVTKTVKDTIYKVEADSSYYHAFIDCVNGKPVIRETTQTKQNSKAGKNLNIPTATLNGNTLTVDCYVKEQELKKQWEETYIKEHEQTPVYIPTPVEVVKPLSWWQKTQIWFGRIFIGILLLFIIIGVLRWKRLI